MKILVTGAFGNIGRQVLAQAIARGHSVSAFEVDTNQNRRAAGAFSKNLRSLFWGDIRNPADVWRAISGQDAIIHLAGIIPPASERNPDLCRAVNVGGTRNLAEAIRDGGNRTSLVFASSATVMGHTQDKKPPLKATDPMNPTDAYTRSKAEAETLLADSGIRHCALRLTAVMPTAAFYSTKLFAAAFEIPLNVRCEVVVDIDVATACVNAAEALPTDRSLAGATYFIGGGKRNGCQMNAREMFTGLFGPLRIPLPEERLFAPDRNGYSLDWYDTEEAEAKLHFQNHSFEEYGRMLARNYRPVHPLILIFRHSIAAFIARKSPYFLT